MKSDKKNKEFPALGNSTDTQVFLPHGKAVTRRDMLKAGLIQFSAAMTLPTVYDWLARAGVAEAQEITCDSGGANTMPVFVHLSLAGGAAIMANFVPHTIQGQMLPSYSVLGLGNPSNLQITREFANQAPFPGNNVSGLIVGIRAGAQITTLQNTVMVGMPTRTQDDSSNNQFDPTGAITRAGLKGNSLPNLGTVGSPTGGRHQPAFVPPPAPLIVNNYNDLAAAINVAGALGQLTTNQKSGLFRLASRLTAAQADTLAGMSGGAQLAALAQCASNTNLKLVGSGSNGTSPLDDAAVSQVWGINTNTDRGNRNFVFAAMVYNALKGNAGTINLNMGGYDYHGGQRNNTNAQDNAAGLVVGRILQTAAVMQRPIFVMLSTDGAVGSPSSDSSAVNFASDRGAGGGCHMYAYHPTKKPSASGSQVGGMTTGQAADDNFITGASAAAAASAVVANYLSFAGKLSMFESLGMQRFSTDQLAQIVKISAG